MATATLFVFSVYRGGDTAPLAQAVQKLSRRLLVYEVSIHDNGGFTNHLTSAGLIQLQLLARVEVPFYVENLIVIKTIEIQRSLC